MAYITGISVGSDWQTQEVINVRITVHTSSSAVQVDKFVVQVKDQWGNTVFNSGEYYMRGGAVHQFDINCGRQAPGTRHERRLSVSCWSNYSGGYEGSGSGTLYSQTRPNPTISAGNIALGTGTATSRTINYSGLYLPGNERLSYETYAGAFVQRANGSASGSFILSGFPVNTQKSLAFGIVEQNTAGPYYTHISKIVYPNYSNLTKGAIAAERVQNTPSSIKVTWGAWGNFGNLAFNAYIEILNGTTNAVVKTQSINVKTASSATVTGIALDIPIKVRIRVAGNYHDGTLKTEYSATVDLGYLNNTWVKVNGSWRRGIRTYIKVNGTWRANNGLVRTKTSGVWK